MKPGLWSYIVERDARWLWEQSAPLYTYPRWRQEHRVVCVVPALEPANRHPCSGAQQVDHVHGKPVIGGLGKTHEGGFGKRAPDDPMHLVAMCENHNVWHPPSAALREAERAYLARAEAASA